MAENRLKRWVVPLLLIPFLQVPKLLVAAASEMPRHGDEEREPQESQRPRRGGSPDFLFRAPRGSLGVGGGWGFARAGSDVFDFVIEQLTVERSDFSAPLLALDVTWPITPRIAGMFRFEYARSEAGSEFRDYVDQDDNPITQSTELTRIPLTGTLKFYLSPRGRQISRYAWVPHTVAPYLGAGGGWLWYRFRQVGDFVDFADLSIFVDSFHSEGWTPTVHVLGGAEVKLAKRFFLTLEAGYAWADSELGADFVDFDPIDLSGFRTIVGVDLLF